MSEIAKKKDSLKSKKHTFYSIFKIILYTINICLWCLFILVWPHLKLEHFMSGRVFEFMVQALIGYPALLYVGILLYFLIPVFYLFMSLTYVF